jgi:hypothetical protein
MIEIKEGLRMVNDDETLNFALTSMQICGLLLFDKKYTSESPVKLPKNIDELRYSDLFAKIILLKKEKEITLFKDETVLFYIAVNLASQCFVSDKEDIVKSIIPYLSEITEDEYNDIKHRYIIKAQDAINLINNSFATDNEFQEELNLSSDGTIKMVSNISN